MLERTRLRNNVIELLEKVSELDDIHIYKSHLTAIDAEVCPAICIDFPFWTRLLLSGSQSPDYITNLQLNIHIYVNVTQANWADELKILCETVEQILLGQSPLLKEFSEAISCSTAMLWKPGTKPDIASAALTIEYGLRGEFPAPRGNAIKNNRIRAAYSKIPANDNSAPEEASLP